MYRAQDQHGSYSPPIHDTLHQDIAPCKVERHGAHAGMPLVPIEGGLVDGGAPIDPQYEEDYVGDDEEFAEVVEVCDDDDHITNDEDD